jgi:hypothetical protein
MTTPYEHVVVVTRRTELEELLVRFSTIPQTRFYLEHAGLAFAPIEDAHQAYHAALTNIRRAIPQGIKTQVIDRGLVPQYTFGKNDLVVTVGQDGLVSNTAKYLEGQPILAVNPDPARFDGYLLPFEVPEFAAALRATLNEETEMQEVTLARARLNDGQELLAFNDFFIGASSHVSARYELRVGKQAETQSSSGIIVSTGAGSTGWLQSVYAGATGVIEALGGTVTPPPNNGRLEWNARKLVYTVREPFPSQTTGTELVHGTLSALKKMVIESQMATDGVIFSDGMQTDYMQFNRGAVATIGVARKRARLVV